jgi:hypothetical protein
MAREGRTPEHTLEISLQMRESRVDQKLIQVNFTSLMRY